MKVAVYWTLKKWYYYHNFLANAKFLYNSFIGIWALKDVWYPCVKLGNKEMLEVEVYEINKDILQKLDELEEVPDEYIRKTIEILAPNNTKDMVFIYEYVGKIDKIDYSVLKKIRNAYTWVGKV